MSEVEARARQNLALSARHQAVRALIEAHQDEYDEIIARERVARGLTETPSESSATPQVLRNRIARAKAKIEAWEAQLNGSPE